MEETLGWGRVVLEASVVVGEGWRVSVALEWRWVASCSSSWCIKRCFSWISSLFPSQGTTALSAWSQRNSGSVVGTGHSLGEDKDESPLSDVSLVLGWCRFV